MQSISPKWKHMLVIWENISVFNTRISLFREKSYLYLNVFEKQLVSLSTQTPGINAKELFSSKCCSAFYGESLENASAGVSDVGI